jgi:putative membrane protein
MGDRQDAKYVQQHLANERTYLAWIRTSITIVGLGFLAAGVIFRTSTYGMAGHRVAAVVGIGAVVAGSAIMGLATKDYFIKRKGINEEAFQSTALLIWLMLITLGVVDICLVILVVILMFY